MKAKHSPNKSLQQSNQNEIKRVFLPWQTPSLFFVGKLKDIVLNDNKASTVDNVQQTTHTGRIA